MAERTIAGVGVLLLVCVTASLFGPASFSSDDFKNLAFAQQITGRALIVSNTQPAHNIFRPVGMTLYWVLWRLFGLNPFPYRAVALFVHIANIYLVFSILKFACGSNPAAAMGAFLFASQFVFASIFYDFGTIFELLSAFWFFLALRIFFSAGHTFKGILFVSLACFLANNAKEMAITLPAVLLLYELLIGKRWQNRKEGASLPGIAYVFARQLLMPTAIVLWFFLTKLPGLQALPASDPYYMEFSGITLGRGYGWYFNSLYQTHLRWPGWLILATLAGALFILKRNGWALFFLLYVFLTLIPVLFLIHHRYEFYWYLPLLGLCGLIALLTKSAAAALPKRVLRPAGFPALPTACLLLLVAHYAAVERLTRPLRVRVHADAKEHLNFVQDLRAQARPHAGETIYYRSVPRTFDEDAIPAATQVALERSDIQGKQVEEYPPDARWRFRFQDSRLIRDDK